ncbi:MAG TPA: GyrI-like domain-containing protein [Clostridia bacterium]|nr:GyrI-like domain-containing protein [Clostridia bacterium]
MKYSLVNLDQKNVVGLEIKTTNENMKAVQDIAALWQDFMCKGHYSSVPNKSDQTTIGLYTDYEGNFTKPYSFLTCCEVNGFDSLSSPLVSKTISAGKYAKFTSYGNPQEAVAKTWSEIWTMDLPRKYACDFEVYHSDLDKLGNQTIDIFISLV